MGILFSPCPDNCFSLNSEMSLSPSLQIEHSPAENIDPGIELSVSDDLPKNAKESLVQIDVYCTKQRKTFSDKPKFEQEIELGEVHIQLIRSSIHQYQRFKLFSMQLRN